MYLLFCIIGHSLRHIRQCISVDFDCRSRRKASSQPQQYYCFDGFLSTTAGVEPSIYAAVMASLHHGILSSDFCDLQVQFYLMTLII